MKTIRIAARAAALCAFVLPFAAASIVAQSSSCTNINMRPHPAPAAVLQDARPTDGATRYTMTVRQPSDSLAKPLGTMTVTQTTTRCSADAIIQRVIVYDYGAAGRVVDTTLSLASSLAPISERTHKKSGDIFLDFSAGVVSGSMSRAGTTRAIHDTLAAPAFNSTDLELVVRSLALRFGLTTVLQIYDPEFGGYRPDSVSVVQLDPARAPSAEGTWVVRSRDLRIENTYRIAERSRRLLAIDVRADSTRYHIALSDPSAPRVAAIAITGPGAAQFRRPAIVAPDAQMRMLARRGGDTTEKEFANITSSTFTLPDSANMLFATSSWTGKGMAYYDTLAIRLPTLAPAWERYSFNGMTNVIAYDGAGVHAVRTPKDSLASVFDTVFARPVFAFVQVEPILGSMPLAIGFETILPLYSENDRALEMDTISVVGTGRSAANGHRTWTVRFADPVVVAKYDVDDVTRETIGYTVTNRRSGSSMRRVSASAANAGRTSSDGH